jgi:hypothetical protein
LSESDELSLGRDARERFQRLLTAMRDAETQRELMLFIERFFAVQVEVRQYFSLIEREIIDKLREFREVEERESASNEPLDREATDLFRHQQER